jgi:hypothetical protein
VPAEGDDCGDPEQDDRTAPDPPAARGHREHPDGQRQTDDGDDADREDQGMEAGPALDDLEHRVLLSRRQVACRAHGDAG